MGEAITAILNALSDAGFEFSVAGLGSIIALVSTGATVIFMVRKNRIEVKTGTRSYEKDVQMQMVSDLRKLRRNSEKYYLLRKAIIEESGVDHLSIIKKMEDEYKGINPEED